MLERNESDARVRMCAHRPTCTSVHACARQHVYIGAVHKVRHARGGGVREGVTVCDRGM